MLTEKTDYEHMTRLMRYLTAIAVGLMLASCSGPDPISAYAKQFGTKANDFAYAVAVDKQGNSYVAGSTEGAIEGVENKGYRDATVVKFDATGNKIWAKTFGTESWEETYSIAIDSKGDIYVTGYTYGTFEGAQKTGGYDVFVLKLDKDGNQLWVKQFGTSVDDYAYGISLDGADNAYVAGYTYGGFPDFKNSGKADIFVLKLDKDGNQFWAKQSGGNQEDIAYSITADPKGGAYVSGVTSGTLDGQSSAGASDAFIAKFDANGNKQWLKQFGSASWDEAWATASDKSGNVYVAGYTGGTIGKGKPSGASDVFMAVYDPTGNQTHIFQTGTVENDYCHSVAVDDEGNAYLSGYTYGGFDGRKNSGRADLLILKINPKSGIAWHSQFGSAEDDFSFGSALDLQKNFYVVGETSGSLGEANAGKYDIFINKTSNPAPEGFFDKVKRIFRNALRKIGIGK